MNLKKTITRIAEAENVVKPQYSHLLINPDKAHIPKLLSFHVRVPKLMNYSTNLPQLESQNVVPSAYELYFHFFNRSRKTGK